MTGKRFFTPIWQAMIVTLRTLSVVAALAVAAPALAQEHGEHQHEGHKMPSTANDETVTLYHPPQTAPIDVPLPVHAMHGDLIGGGLQGGYPMGRDASGTSWQPDTSMHGGLHAMRGDWQFMGHALINGVYDWQDGPRGDEKAFVSGMVMGAARYDDAGGDTINFRLMLSPDAFSGKRGYPLLLAAGETADGATPLVDRQHPHELLMEASASYAHRISDADSVFIYAGLPGEPAFGPPAFMHRATAMDSPEAPISHHWLDSTHITFGVLTGGWVHQNFKLEASGFRGREPDEDRYDIESPDIDSASVRASWNPTPRWALQASWADVKSPEQLEPDEDETRWSASALYAASLGGDASWSATAAFGRKERSDGVDLNAGLVEATLRPSAPWTIFARGELIESDELGAIAHGPVETVAKASLGAIRDFRVHENAVIGVGALVSKSWVGDGLRSSYGGDPEGGMAFVRLKIG